MNKRRKIWLIVLVLLLLLDIILHFTVHVDGGHLFGMHLNYIASVLMAFTVGAEINDSLWR